MAATVSQSITNKGTFTATVTTTVGTVGGPVEVGNLREVTVTVRRTGGAADTFSVEGSSDGVNFGAITSQTQVAGADAVLTGISTIQTHTIRQKVRFIRLVSSGTTDPGEMVVTGTTRN